MEINLGENIRTFRKQRSLTQEQLAEVLGVTVGAVYKWEAKLSVPDLRLIMEMADFFDTSVDVLLGYEMKDNRQAATVTRLKKYLHDRRGAEEKRKEDVRKNVEERTGENTGRNVEKNVGKSVESISAGITEAEKALKKYPNCFEVVYTCASLYQVFGLEQADREKLRRAFELFERARLLLDQNQDSTVSELTIFGNMAEIYMAMGDGEQAVELLKKNNSGGIFNDLIGLTLAAACKRPEEAVPFLAKALILHVVSAVRITMGYLNVFFARGDYGAAREILDWSMKVLDGLTYEGKRCFIDKIESVLYVCLAYTQMKSGDTYKAQETLCMAKKIAENFDAAPDYDTNKIRFADTGEPSSAHDDLGETAMEGVQKAISDIGDEKLDLLWKGINNYEK